MTALAIGSSVTALVRDGGTVAVATNGGLGSVTRTAVGGTTATINFGPEPTRRIFGPYSEGASVSITNISCNAFDYDPQTTDAASDFLGAFAWLGLPDPASYAGYRARVTDRGYYALSDGVSWNAIYNPSSVAITGGTIGGAVLSFNDPTAAAANVAAINAALLNGVDLWILTPGTLYINAPIVMQNGSRLRVGNATTVKLASGSNCVMLTTAAFQPSGALQKAVTLTWTAGLSCQVTYATAHGLTREDYVWIQGAAQAEYNNVFRVVNVIDANNILVTLRRTPQTAATGSPVAQPCTRGFVIDGGMWDYNTSGNPSGTGYNKDVWGIYAAANFRCVGARFNYLHRAVTTGALADYEFSDMFYRTDLTNAAEAHKTYGPINGGKLRNIVALSSDDTMSVQPKEAAAFGWTGIPFGDIFDLTFDNVSGKSYGNANAGAFPVYLSDNETVDNLIYRNCSGFSDQGCAYVIKYGDLYSAGKFGQIRYEHCSGSIGATAATGGQYPFSAAAGGDRLSFVGFQPMAADTVGTHYMMRIQSGVAINEVDIEAKFSNAAFSASGGTFLVVSGTVNTLRLANSHLTANTNVTWIGVNGTVFDFSAENCNVGASGGFLSVNSGGTIYNALLKACNFNGCGYGVLPTSTGTPCNVTLLGNSFQNMALGAVRPNTGTGVVCRIYGSGNYYNSAATVNAGGSATFELHSFDMPINVAQTGAIKTVSGQYAFNTTANGTLAANRLVTCNGTNWVQVDTPANVF